MEFSDHKYAKNKLSFAGSETIWKYLDSYAHRFGVKKFTRFNHMVTNVTPIDGKRWKVAFKDLPNNKFESKEFDAVIVCNGHNFSSKIPAFEGADEFSGKILHSHNFRDAATFAGKEERFCSRDKFC